VLAAGTIVTVTARFSIVVMPMLVSATRADGLVLLGRILRVVFAVALIGSTLMALLAEPIFALAFGDEFTRSVPPLLILLPGIVAWALNTTASAGLQAFDLPGRSSWSQAGAVAITVVGLILTLPRYGIVGAAATSSVAYTCALGITMCFLARECGFAPRQVLALHRLPTDVRVLARRSDRSESATSA